MLAPRTHGTKVASNVLLFNLKINAKGPFSFKDFSQQFADTIKNVFLFILKRLKSGMTKAILNQGLN